ncbi:efflux RND transporter periplasmic adaptor subunit [Ensifer sp. HO-A22]|uniref:Efflux RND transporter periplasmic adaptor subunit n=2 Tax=Ensifer oleiphilus TaxID=2742698 RepID=A0A7Y6QAB2_9HYPH|nr:efflux RND transporter periplasmic adaptor subunit [Ensifer oleiphilus]NVD41993.1 efflux RND transporter periplasmic adaptor subunit [Ensifer oleiphilus]
MIPSRRYTTLPLFLSISLIAGCEQNSTSGEETSPRPVKSLIARSEQEAVERLPGIVRARIETDLAFRTLGRIVSRNVDVGDLVRKGDVVAEIDPLSLRLSVRSADANLRDAQAHLTNAVLTEGRKRTLAHKNASSIADHELAEQQLKSAEANVARETASLAKAQEQLGYATLRAEFDGVVTATYAEPGQTVSTGQPVLKLARLEQRDVVVDVPEALLSSGHLGDSVDVALQLDRTAQTVGVVREIAPQADPTTRTHRVKLAIDQAPEVFRLGAVVTVKPLAEGNGSITLPSTAIRDKNGVDHVWVVDQSTSTVTPRPVELANRTAEFRFVRILSGLRDGEEVVVAGVNQLADGQKVKRVQERHP